MKNKLKIIILLLFLAGASFFIIKNILMKKDATNLTPNEFLEKHN